MIEGPAAPVSRPPGRRLSFGGVVGSVAEAIGGIRHWGVRAPRGYHDPSDKFLAQLRLVGQIFWVVLAILGTYLVVDIWLRPPQPPTVAALPASVATDRAPTGLEPSAEQRMTRAVEYRQALASRNPFRLEAPKTAQAPTAQTVKSKLAELISTLSIVGINRGAVPEALVEDTQAKRTYFVKVGDQLNGLTVRAIDQNGVTVTYEGEQATLQ